MSNHVVHKEVQLAHLAYSLHELVNLDKLDGKEDQNKKMEKKKKRRRRSQVASLVSRHYITHL